MRKPSTGMVKVRPNSGKTPVKRKRPGPSAHSHELEGMRVGVDETSLMIWGDKILMGPVNLYDVYEQVEKMRQLAEFASLQNPLA